MIFRNYFFINLLLLILISFLGVKAFNAFRFSADLPSETRPAEVKQESLSATPKTVFPGEPVFQVISDKNIFSPTRALVVKKAVNTSGKAVSKEVPKLFGTLIIGSSKSAMLNDPDTKRTKRYFINDTVGDFVVKDIQPEVVFLLRGNETIEIKLRGDKGIAKDIKPRVNVTTNEITLGEDKETTDTAPPTPNVRRRIQQSRNIKVVTPTR